MRIVRLGRVTTGVPFKVSGMPVTTGGSLEITPVLRPRSFSLNDLISAPRKWRLFWIVENNAFRGPSCAVAEDKAGGKVTFVLSVTFLVRAAI